MWLVSSEGIDTAGSPFPHSAHCESFQVTIELVGKRWTASILRTLFSGCSRFGEIIDSVPGLSNRLLSERLDELQDAGLVVAAADTRPLYSLTEKGRDLRQALSEIEAWNHKWSSLGGTIPPAA